MNSIKLDLNVSQQIFDILSKASLESLQTGALIQGKIQSLENGLLFIKLMDGGSIKAQVPEGFTAQPGENITLEIGEKINQQFTARIVSNEAQSQGKEASGVQTAVSNSLSAMGAAASNGLVNEVMKLIKAEPGLPLNQAAFLTANGMENQPEMLKMLDRITQHEFQLHHQLDLVRDGLAEGLKEAGEQVKQLLEPLVTSQKAEELSGALDKLLAQQSPEQKETIANTLRELLNRTLLEEMPQSQENSATLNLADMAGKIIKGGIALKEALDQSQTQEMFKSALKELLKPHEADSLLKLIQKSLEEVHNQTGKLDKGDADEIKHILDKFFDKALIKAENGKVEATDLNSKAKALKEIMEFSQKALQQLNGANQDKVLPALKEMDQAFRFFNQVVTYDTMIQLPLKINQQSTTGELYVMKRKKGRNKIDADNFTLFLSLKTMNLGRIESFLNATRKVITISFKVEQEELVALVKENHRALYDALIEKGYKLAELKCRVLDKEEAGPLNAAQKAQEALGLETRVDLKI